METTTSSKRAYQLVAGDVWAGNGSAIRVTETKDAGHPFPAFPETPGTIVRGVIIRGYGRGKAVRWTLGSLDWVEVASC